MWTLDIARLVFNCLPHGQRLFVIACEQRNKKKLQKLLLLQRLSDEITLAFKKACFAQNESLVLFFSEFIQIDRVRNDCMTMISFLAFKLLNILVDKKILQNSDFYQTMPYLCRWNGLIANQRAVIASFALQDIDIFLDCMIKVHPPANVICEMFCANDCCFRTQIHCSDSPINFSMRQIIQTPTQSNKLSISLSTPSNTNVMYIYIKYPFFLKL